MAAPDEGEGQDREFKVAIDKAWKNAKDKGNREGWYDLKKVEVRAENPITEYKVTIKRLRDL